MQANIDKLVQLLNELESPDKALRTQAESTLEQTGLEQMIEPILVII